MKERLAHTVWECKYQWFGYQRMGEELYMASSKETYGEFSGSYVNIKVLK